MPPAVLHQADATERVAIVRSDGGRPVGNVPRPESASQERQARQYAGKKVCPSNHWTTPQGGSQGVLRPRVGQSLHPQGMRHSPGNARRILLRVPARPESLRVPRNCHRETGEGGGGTRVGLGWRGLESEKQRACTRITATEGRARTKKGNCDARSHDVCAGSRS